MKSYSWKTKLCLAGVMLGLLAALLRLWRYPFLPDHLGVNIGIALGVIIAAVLILGALFLGIGAIGDALKRKKLKGAGRYIIGGAVILILSVIALVSFVGLCCVTGEAANEAENQPPSTEALEKTPPTTDEATSPAEMPTERDDAAAKEVDKDVGFSEEDFPGYTRIDALRKLLSDIKPAESREHYKAAGFQSAYTTLLQNIVLDDSDIPPVEFREIQSAVFSFSTPIGAENIFNATIAGLEQTYSIIAINVSFVEKEFFYIDEYDADDGTPLRQYTFIFLKGRQYAIASVTARADADAEGVAELTGTAAGILSAKLEVVS